MHIRPFDKTDSEQVVDLWRKCDLIVPWNDPYKDIERKLKVNPELFIVGELNGQIIACVMGGYEGHRGWINYLAVDPSLQRNGYGRQMMAYLEQKLKQMGCPKINLQVRSNNDNVIKFYQSIGYQVDDIINMGKRLIEDLNISHRRDAESAENG